MKKYNYMKEVAESMEGMGKEIAEEGGVMNYEEYYNMRSNWIYDESGLSQGSFWCNEYIASQYIRYNKKLVKTIIDCNGYDYDLKEDAEMCDCLVRMHLMEEYVGDYAIYLTEIKKVIKKEIIKIIEKNLCDGSIIVKARDKQPVLLNAVIEELEKEGECGVDGIVELYEEELVNELIKLFKDTKLMVESRLDEYVVMVANDEIDEDSEKLARLKREIEDLDARIFKVKKNQEIRRERAEKILENPEQIEKITEEYSKLLCKGEGVI